VSNQINETDVEIVIKNNTNWFYIDWQGLLRYRDLILLMVRRDFVSQFKQTILGPAWFILQPLLMTLVFTVIFGKIAKMSTDGTPPMLFYLCGLLGWRYFADCFKANSATFVTNLSLFSKVYFPRLIVPLSVIISQLLTFFIQLVTFICFYIYFKYCTSMGNTFSVNIYIFLFPLLLLQTAALSLGMGLWMSALTAKYRDLRFLMTFFTQLWMYATPVIYPISIIPDKWKFIVLINPMASVVEAYRYMFLGSGTIHGSYLVVSIFITIFIFLTGILIFNKTERTFIDSV